MPKCEHDLAEMKTECADGTCPICACVQAIQMRCMLAALVEEINTGAHDLGVCLDAAKNILTEYT